MTATAASANPQSVTAPAIELRGLRKRFGHTEVLRSVDLVVPRNSVFGFLGPNGAGKSTTMKILVGLLRATSGSAEILGHSIRRDGLEARSRLGFLPQDVRYWPHLTVRGVLTFTARQYGSLSRSAVEERVTETIDLAGLGDLADRRVGNLSGGQRQRFGVAEAWVGHPDVLVLDEPSSGLDPEGRREVLDLLDQLRQQATILYSTHILDDVERVADHVAVIDRGVIVATGPIEEFLVGASAVFRVRIAGPDHGGLAAVGREPWVDAIARVDEGLFEVAVNDRTTAEHRLLRDLVEHRAHVSELRPARRSLEDLYLELVGATARSETTGGGTDDG